MQGRLPKLGWGLSHGSLETVIEPYPRPVLRDLCIQRHEHGYSTASFDKLYGDPMDFLRNSGYTSYGCT